MIKKTHRKSLVEQVAEQIEHLIEQGHWTLGEKIPPEKELMEEFDVSRNTLREAIRALVHAGLLETKQGSGTIVHHKSALGAALERHVKKSSMLETLEVRFALEKQAAEMAAERRTETNIVRMETYLDNCKKAAKNVDLNTFITNDILFHKTIVQSSDNQLLIDLYEHMTEVLYMFVQDILTMNISAYFEQEQHRGLLEALKQQDKASAALYVEQDMEILKVNIMKLMED